MFNFAFAVGFIGFAGYINEVLFGEANRKKEKELEK
jgi:hypothetical protein